MALKEVCETPITQPFRVETREKTLLALNGQGFANVRELESALKGVDVPVDLVTAVGALSMGHAHKVDTKTFYIIGSPENGYSLSRAHPSGENRYTSVGKINLI